MRRVSGSEPARRATALLLAVALVIGATACGGDDAAGQADDIGDEVFAAMTDELEPTIEGGYFHDPMPMAESCEPTEDEPWRGWKTWDLAGNLLPQEQMWNDIVEHLQADGWDITPYAKESDDPVARTAGLTAERADGEEGLSLILSSNGSSTLVVYVGPCATVDLGFSAPWEQHAPTWLPEP
jgi:hypothetical protein